jgi:hypothetical protein
MYLYRMSNVHWVFKQLPIETHGYLTCATLNALSARALDRTCTLQSCDRVLGAGQAVARRRIGRQQLSGTTFT